MAAARSSRRRWKAQAWSLPSRNKSASRSSQGKQPARSRTRLMADRNRPERRRAARNRASRGRHRPGPCAASWPTPATGARAGANQKAGSLRYEMRVGIAGQQPYARLILPRPLEIGVGTDRDLVPRCRDRPIRRAPCARDNRARATDPRATPLRRSDGTIRRSPNTCRPLCRGLSAAGGWDGGRIRSAAARPAAASPRPATAAGDAG